MTCCLVSKVVWWIGKGYDNIVCNKKIENRGTFKNLGKIYCVSLLFLRWHIFIHSWSRYYTPVNHKPQRYCSSKHNVLLLYFFARNPKAKPGSFTFYVAELERLGFLVFTYHRIWLIVSFLFYVILRLRWSDIVHRIKAYHCGDNALDKISYFAICDPGKQFSWPLLWWDDFIIVACMYVQCSYACSKRIFWKVAMVLIRPRSQPQPLESYGPFLERSWIGPHAGWRHL